GRLAAPSNTIVIYTPHAFPFLVSSAIKHGARVAERLLARRTDLLVAVSSAEGRLAVASGAITQDRLRVVENAVQRPIAIGPRPTWGAPRTFGFIGELREQKAPLIFIEAAAALVATGRHARFILPKRGCQLRAAT